MSTTRFSYDAIADVYATDMGQSMPFDDVGWYRSVCVAHDGCTLELGCGTGRILIELLAGGVDAFGVDRSGPMLRRLRRDAAARGLAPRVAQMDLRGLALRGRFSVILAPYSLITYLIDREVAAASVKELAALLEPGGCLVLDAFVPQPVASFAEFRLDYRRAHGSGALERHKRITAHADGTHRIERRYRVHAGDGALTQEFLTDETIRPYSPADLSALGAAANLDAEACVWDYGTRKEAAGARFATWVLRARR